MSESRADDAMPKLKVTSTLPSYALWPARRRRLRQECPVLSAALYERFSSRGEDDFAEKVLSAWRFQFGGHPVKAADSKAGA